MNQETLTQLLPLLRSGDRGAWERLYLELGPKLVHFAQYNLGLNEQDAEDIAQEALVNIRQSIQNHNYSTNKKPVERLGPGYFYTQLRWQVSAHRRKRARETAFDALELQVQDEILKKIATDHQRIVDEQYENIDELRVVREQCWWTLEKRERTVLHLRYIDGLKLRETGERMGISLHTVKSIETRAIGKLRAWLLPLES
jgi:RNA polymerase sigma factor (sigma-70 family)